MSHLEKNICAYGLMNDQLVHIDQVESGLACDCFCVGCGDKLVAKKGEVKQHHFAHHTMDSNECNESALHKICKHIVENEKRILSPELTVSCHQFDLAGIEHAKHETLAPELLMFTEALLEHTVGDFIPDVTGVFDHQQRVFIEIVVTNDVSEEKLEKVKRLGVPMMAIYVSELDLMEPLESLTASVTEQAPRKWIYHPIIEQLETRLRNELEFEISIINERMRLAVLEEQETSNQSTPIVLKQNQMLLLGYNSAHGYSRKKARNFDFSMLHVTNPIRSSSTVNYTVRANGGYEVKSIYFDEALLPQLAAMTFPCVVELGIKAAFISGRPATLVDSITTV